MRTIKLFFGGLMFSLLLAACSSGYTAYQYDDLYYSPNNDPVKQVQKNPREDFNKTDNIKYDGSYQNRYKNEEKPSNYPESIYQNRYTQAEQAENQTPNNSQTEPLSYTDNEEVEYYDQDYANTMRQINSPVRSFDTYNTYQRDRIIYTNDPFFVTPSVYGRYTFWDPFVPATGLSVGWNSFSGWNVGVGLSFGNTWGCAPPINPYFGYGFYDPFWGPYNNFYGGFGSPFYWNRWNSWNNPYAWNNPYWAGYNRGFNDGFYGNGFYGNGYYNAYNGSDRSGGRRNISAPRGNSGSKSVNSTEISRSTRTTRSNRISSGNSKSTNTSSTINNSNRPTRTNRTVTNKSGSSEGTTSERPTRSTPNQYKTPKNPTYYSQPSETTRPTRIEGGNNDTRSTIRNNETIQQNTDRPEYVRPRQNNTYNNSNRVVPNQSQPNRQQTQPRQQQYSQPRQQSRPTNNYNRSRPSYNRSTPSYSAPSRSTPRSTSPSRTRPSRR